jgi:hypothetical protein
MSSSAHYLGLALLGSALALPVHAFDGYGEWHGQAQYIVSRRGQQAPTVQEVVPLVIRVDPDGKVIGTSSENGCRLLGTLAPVDAGVMRLDVTFRDCQTKALNRRMTGTVAHYPADKRLAFSASLMDANVKPVATYEVRAAIMRR